MSMSGTEYDLANALSRPLAARECGVNSRHHSGECWCYRRSLTPESSSFQWVHKSLIGRTEVW